MVEVAERPDAVLHDLVAPQALHVHDEVHAAGVVLEARVVEALGRGGTSEGLRHASSYTGQVARPSWAHQVGTTTSAGTTLASPWSRREYTDRARSGHSERGSAHRPAPPVGSLAVAPDATPTSDPDDRAAPRSSAGTSRSTSGASSRPRRRRSTPSAEVVRRLAARRRHAGRRDRAVADRRRGATSLVRGGSVVAWATDGGRSPAAGFRIVGAHTDSPNLRVRPRPDTGAAGFRQLGVEVYGGVLLNSWLDRDLGLSGRVALRGPDGAPELRLFRIDEPLLRVPQLAIHLDRGGQRRGREARPPGPHGAGLGHRHPGRGRLRPLRRRAASESRPDAVLSWDVMAHDLTPPALLGTDRSLFAAPRIDNQLSCHAATTALAALLAEDAPGAPVPVVCLFDHEEIGSESASGAGELAPAHRARADRPRRRARPRRLVRRPRRLGVPLGRRRPRHPPELRGPSRARPPDRRQRRPRPEAQRQRALRHRRRRRRPGRDAAAARRRDPAALRHPGRHAVRLDHRSGHRRPPRHHHRRRGRGPALHALGPRAVRGRRSRRPSSPSSPSSCACRRPRWRSHHDEGPPGRRLSPALVAVGSLASACGGKWRERERSDVTLPVVAEHHDDGARLRDHHGRSEPDDQRRATDDPGADGAPVIRSLRAEPGAAACTDGTIPVTVTFAVDPQPPVRVFSVFLDGAPAGSANTADPITIAAVACDGGVHSVLLIATGHRRQLLDPGRRLPVARAHLKPWTSPKRSRSSTSSRARP